MCFCDVDGEENTANGTLGRGQDGIRVLGHRLCMSQVMGLINGGPFFLGFSCGVSVVRLGARVRGRVRMLSFLTDALLWERKRERDRGRFLYFMLMDGTHCSRSRKYTRFRCTYANKKASTLKLNTFAVLSPFRNIHP